jgi:hypothetical protein
MDLGVVLSASTRRFRLVSSYATRNPITSAREPAREMEPAIPVLSQ